MNLAACILVGLLATIGFDSAGPAIGWCIAMGVVNAAVFR